MSGRRYVLVEISGADAPDVDWDGSVRLALLEEPWFERHGVRTADVTDFMTVTSPLASAAEDRFS